MPFLEVVLSSSSCVCHIQALISLQQLFNVDSGFIEEYSSSNLYSQIVTSPTSCTTVENTFIAVADIRGVEGVPVNTPG